MASFYKQIIAEAVPGLTDRQYSDIEQVMRCDIFHSTLDWQTCEELKRAAREAVGILAAEWLEPYPGLEVYRD